MTTANQLLDICESLESIDESKAYHDTFKVGDKVRQPNKGRDGKVTEIKDDLVYVDFGKNGTSKFQLDGRISKDSALPSLYLESTKSNLMK